MVWGGYAELIAEVAEPVAALRPTVEVTYWTIVLDVLEIVTPLRWRCLVDATLAQALDGDPRAREWLGRVLGAEAAISAVGESRVADANPHWSRRVARLLDAPAEPSPAPVASPEDAASQRKPTPNPPT